MRHIFCLLVIVCATFFPLSAHAQGIVKGLVVDDLTNEPVPFATVQLQGTDIGAVTDIEGKYRIENIKPGLYNLECSFVGYKKEIVFEIQINADRPAEANFRLREQASNLGEVEIRASPFSKTEESPVSLNAIGVNEIQRNPGGNRDISRAVTILPGVATSVAFRNDLIVRGGSPAENAFFLDGIEVPNINHFATQGGTGGPVGLINVNFIENVDFYSGSFPASRSSGLSSLLEFRQKDANTEGLLTNFTLSSTDAGLTFDTPINDKSGLIFSIRRSYLQFLFEVLQLPFLPTYTDSQFKYKYKFNQRNELTLIGLGAYDNLVLNTATALDSEDEETVERNQYIIGNLPENIQWNYTVGGVYKHYGKDNFQEVVLSRNQLYNGANRYINNDRSSPDNLTFDFASQEIENKFRFEHTQQKNAWKLNTGVAAEYFTFKNSTFSRVADASGNVNTVDFSAQLSALTYGGFAQVSRTLFAERLLVSGGLRIDGSNYNTATQNPLRQFSPRLALSYKLTDRWSLNASAGRYFQLPPYTVLGFQANNGVFVNRDVNRVTYIRSDQLVAGVEYFIAEANTKISLEGFYKQYNDYPFLTTDSISLANLGGDFGIVGNEPASSIGLGRARGLELLVQRKLYKKTYGVLAVTYVRSEFTDKDGTFVPSAWDNRFIVSLTGGRKFGKDWELGVRFGYQGGAPYTPFNFEVSGIREVWDVRGVGVPDYDRLNAERNPGIYFVDARIDKRYYFDKWNLNVYFDIRNLTRAEVELQPFVDTVRDPQGNPVVDPNNSSRYLLREISNSAGTFLPSLGIVAEF